MRPRPLPVAATAAGLASLVRAATRRGRASGVTSAERDRPLPGDDLVPGARVVIDRATTLPAPPEQVWPWIVQLGKLRGGWYLPAWLETAVPAARRGLRVIDPRWQGLAPGDVIPDWGGADATFEVVVLEAPRALVHRSTRPRPGRDPLELSWALVLTPQGRRTRLHLRLRINSVGRRAPALVATLAGLVDEVTVRPMFAGLAERLRQPAMTG
jgi:hypothetical protein